MAPGRRLEEARPGATSTSSPRSDLSVSGYCAEKLLSFVLFAVRMARSGWAAFLRGVFVGVDGLPCPFAISGLRRVGQGGSNRLFQTDRRMAAATTESRYRADLEGLLISIKKRFISMKTSRWGETV